MTKTGKVKAVALVAAVGLLPLGCSDSSKQPDSGPPQDVATTSRSRPASRCPRLTADPADADRLADAVAGMLACHDTRSDDSPLDATRRAAQWLDPAIVPEPGAQIRTDATWTAWAGLDAGTSREDRPADPARLHRLADRPGQTDDEHTDRRLGRTRRTSPDHAVDPDPGQTRRRLAGDDDPGNVIAARPGPAGHRGGPPPSVRPAPTNHVGDPCRGPPHMLFASGSVAVMGYASGRWPTRLDIGSPLPQAPGAPRG